jgi:arabinogalactan oligomer/maltooligosaccharide transport system permease protein
VNPVVAAEKKAAVASLTVSSPAWSARIVQVASALTAHGLLSAAVIFALYPLLWILATALSAGDLGQHTAAGRFLPFPRQLSLRHFAALFAGAGTGPSWLFARQLGNSLLIAGATAVAALALASPSAYALSRFSFVGRKTSVKVLAATQMFPGVAAAIPLYLILNALHLLNNRLGLVLVYASTAVPFAIFQLRAAFDAVPRELEEAAMVGGASRLQAMILIVLPAVRPALTTTGLFAFMGAWNEFILAATFLTREELFTTPVALQRYVGEHDTQWGPFAAGAVLVSIPVMALFLWLQRHLVSGLTEGGVKG